VLLAGPDGHTRTTLVTTDGEAPALLLRGADLRPRFAAP
jgi:hypothetical protein